MVLWITTTFCLPSDTPRIASFTLPPTVLESRRSPRPSVPLPVKSANTPSCPALGPLQAPTGQASWVATTAIGVRVADTVSKKLAPT